MYAVRILNTIVVTSHHMTSLCLILQNSDQILSQDLKKNIYIYNLKLLVISVHEIWLTLHSKHVHVLLRDLNLAKFTAQKSIPQFIAANWVKRSVKDGRQRKRNVKYNCTSFQNEYLYWFYCSIALQHTDAN